VNHSLGQGWVLLAQRFLAHAIRQAIEHDGHRNAGATDQYSYRRIVRDGQHHPNRRLGTVANGWTSPRWSETMVVENDPERGYVASSQKLQPPATGPRPVDTIGAPPASTGTRLHALALTVGLIVVTLGVGWLIWSLVEWCRSSTPSYGLTGLRLVRRSDGASAGPVRVLCREVCCLVLIVPTIVVCCALGFTFVMGASPPDDLVRGSRHAPWDVLSGTEVVRVPQQPRYSKFGVPPYEAAQQN
jgi:hypothetical protein